MHAVVEASHAAKRDTHAASCGAALAPPRDSPFLNHSIWPALKVWFSGNSYVLPSARLPCKVKCKGNAKPKVSLSALPAGVHCAAASNTQLAAPGDYIRTAALHPSSRPKSRSQRPRTRSVSGLPGAKLVRPRMDTLSVGEILS